MTVTPEMIKKTKEYLKKNSSFLYFMNSIVQITSLEQAVREMLADSEYIDRALNWSNFGNFVEGTLGVYSQDTIHDALYYMHDPSEFEEEVGDSQSIQKELEFIYALFRAVSVTKIENPDLRKFL
jgi:hypothetical protein